MYSSFNTVCFISEQNCFGLFEKMCWNRIYFTSNRYFSLNCPSWIDFKLYKNQTSEFFFCSYFKNMLRVTNFALNRFFDVKYTIVPFSERAKMFTVHFTLKLNSCVQIYKTVKNYFTDKSLWRPNRFEVYRDVLPSHCCCIIKPDGGKKKRKLKSCSYRVRRSNRREVQ